MTPLFSACHGGSSRCVLTERQTLCTPHILGQLVVNLIYEDAYYRKGGTGQSIKYQDHTAVTTVLSVQRVGDI